MRLSYRVSALLLVALLAASYTVSRVVAQTPAPPPATDGEDDGYEYLEDYYEDLQSQNVTLPAGGPVDCNIKEFQALADGALILNSTNPKWMDLNVCPCNSAGGGAWAGVFCKGTGQDATITSIGLAGMELNGLLPNRWSALTNLETMSFGGTGVRGTLPESWSKLKKLEYLDLTQTNIWGWLPEDWKEMTSLRYLQIAPLYPDALFDLLPDTWSSMTSLTYLLIANTTIEGQLPKEWSAMSSLAILEMPNNMLEGPLPDAWKAMSSLQVLNMPNNSIKGTIPKSWGEKLKDMQYIDLSSNLLEGELPETWSNWGDLLGLNLHDNMLADNLPDSWSALTNLMLLDVSGNRITGDYPNEYSSLSKLTFLGLQNNNASEALCRNSAACLDRITKWITKGPYTSLNVITVSGDNQPIPNDWCTNEKLIIGTDTGRAELVYVGTEPSRKGCFEKLCTTRSSKAYPISYFTDFSFTQAMPEIVEYVAAVFKKTVAIAPTFDRDKVIESERAEVGWIIGQRVDSGYDPCVDDNAPKWVALAAGVWALGVLLIIAYAIARLRFMRHVTDLAQKAPIDQLSPAVAQGLAIINAMQGQQQEEPQDGPKVIRIGWQHRKWDVLRYLWNLRTFVVFYFVFAVVAYHVYLVYPTTTFVIILLGILATEAIAAIRYFWLIRRRVQKAADPTVAAATAKLPEGQAPSEPTKLEAFVERVCLWSASQNGTAATAFATFAAGLLLSPLLLFVIFVMTFSVFLPSYNLKPPVFCGLDIGKCLDMRFFLMAIIADPVFIGFASWAYAYHDKPAVGLYLDKTGFFLALSASFLHLWITIWWFCDVLVQQRGSFRRAASEVVSAEVAVVVPAEGQEEVVVKGVDGQQVV